MGTLGICAAALVHGCGAASSEPDGSTGQMASTGPSGSSGTSAESTAGPSSSASASTNTNTNTTVGESSSTTVEDGSSGEPDTTGGPEGQTIVVGVGNWGHRGTTTDGVRWIDVMNEPPPDGNDHTPDLLRGVGYGDGMFVAVGGDANGMVMSTTDGEQWQEDLFPEGDGWLGDVAWLDGIWVAVGGNGIVVRSTDGGVTWSQNEETLSAAGRTIIAAGDEFVASGDGGLLAVSSDGVAWDEVTDPSGIGFSLAYGLDTVVGFASQWNGAGFDTACTQSADAQTWSPCALTSASFGAPAAGEDAIVVQIDGGFAVTTDGAEWSAFDDAFPERLVYADGLWVGLSYQRRWYAASYAGPWESFEDVDGFRDIAAGVVFESP